MSANDLTAVLAALTAMLAAVLAVIREIRNFRKDVVSAVEAHMRQSQLNADVSAAAAAALSRELPQQECRSGP